MSPPRHRIRRQIFEIQVPDTSAAWPLQTLLSTLQVQKIEPLLDALLSQLCPSDTLLRIDRLEIDLGVLSLPQLAEDLPRKLATALPQALPQALRNQQRRTDGQIDGTVDADSEPPGDASRLELLAYFAQTGQLPWWADARQPQPLSAALEGLLGAPPPSLPRRLRDLLADRTRRLRLIQHLPDDSLLRLCASLAAPTAPPAMRGEPKGILHALLDVARRAGLTQLAVPAMRLRQSLFLATLGRLASHASPPPPWRGPALVQDLLPYVALEAGLSHVALARGLFAELPSTGGNAAQEALREALADTLSSPTYAAMDSQAKRASPSYRQSPGRSAVPSGVRPSTDRAAALPGSRPSPLPPPTSPLLAETADLPSVLADASPRQGEGHQDLRPGEDHAPVADAFASVPPPDDLFMPHSIRESEFERNQQLIGHSVHQHSPSNESAMTAQSGPSPAPKPDRPRPEGPRQRAQRPPAQPVGEAPRAETDQATDSVFAELCDQLAALYDSAPAAHQSSILAVLRLLHGNADVDGLATVPTVTAQGAQGTTAATVAPEPDATTDTQATAATALAAHGMAATGTVTSPDVMAPDGTTDATTSHEAEADAAEPASRNAIEPAATAERPAVRPPQAEAESARPAGARAESARPAPADHLVATGWPTARLRQLLQLLLHLRPLRLVPVATLGAALAAVGSELARRAAAQSVAQGPLAMSRPPRRLPPTAQPIAPALDLAFSRSEEVYVQNAGLVLLWPFLSPLFHALGLCFRGQFADPMAMHRATGLLHYLVTGEREPVEYQLTLAKLLCGLDDEDLLEFGEPVSDAEAEECDRALQAAIAHAQILGEISPTDFRTLFLLSQGVLSPRAESLLLRVERTPHTALVERFPWPCSWIRLPWLRIPLQVEW